MIEITKANIASYIDHTLLKQNVSIDDIKKLCYEANENNFASVCILPYYVESAANELRGSNVKICTVIGFPLGANLMETKVNETIQTIEKGATEIDMVINLPAFFNKNYDYVKDEINLINSLCKDSNSILKVIVETCLLDEHQKVIISDIVRLSGAEFIKTSTGFSTGGATIDDVKLLKEKVGTEVKVKASGGIRDLETTLKMIEAGANRIGTSSGIKIINEIN